MYLSPKFGQMLEKIISGNLCRIISMKSGSVDKCNVCVGEKEGAKLTKLSAVNQFSFIDDLIDKDIINTFLVHVTQRVH